MNNLSILLAEEISKCLHYGQSDIAAIILAKRYEKFWTGNIQPYMLRGIIENIRDYTTLQQLYKKYKLPLNVITNSVFLRHICTHNDYIIQNKYTFAEQQIISRAIMNDLTCIIYTINDILFFKYIVITCTDDIDQLEDYKNMLKQRYQLTPDAIDVIDERINELLDILLYETSLRNMWIIACIT